MFFCKDCSFYKEKNSTCGYCKYANKRSVSLYTLSIRSKFSKRELEKDIQYLIANSEPMCQNFLNKVVSTNNK